MTFDAPSVRADLGMTIYFSWEAGLEIVAPLPEKTAFNAALHERLVSRGEGVLSVIIGVDDLEGARDRIRAAGYSPGPNMGKDPHSPWAHKLTEINEVMAGTLLDTWFIFGDITYAEGVVRAE